MRLFGIIKEGITLISENPAAYKAAGLFGQACLSNISSIFFLITAFSLFSSIGPHNQIVCGLARFTKSISEQRLATLSSGKPCWRVPKNSPGPLSSKSFSAILKPSEVSVMIFCAALLCLSRLRKIKCSMTSIRPCLHARAAGEAVKARTARRFQLSLRRRLGR